MAFDAFLQIDGIPGESTDDKHADWIEVLNYEFEIKQPTSASKSSTGGASSERADFKDFSIKKALDKASPKIAIACADGTAIKSVILELCRSGGDKVKYMEYKMSNCVISKVSPAGESKAPETLPLEEVTFNYGKLEMVYTQQKREDGSGGGQVAAGWDLQKNAKV
jgi:type VI secretion system secreted protein Hcp